MTGEGRGGRVGRAGRERIRIDFYTTVLSTEEKSSPGRFLETLLCRGWGGHSLNNICTVKFYF
jgi:hypothetical protein